MTPEIDFRVIENAELEYCKISKPIDNGSYRRALTAKAYILPCHGKTKAFRTCAVSI